MPTTKPRKNTAEKARLIARQARRAWKHRTTEAARPQTDSSHDAAWRRWVEYLGKRSGPPPLATLLSARRGHPLTWALPAAAATEETTSLLRDLLETPADENTAACAEAWLAESGRWEGAPSQAFEALTIAHALPGLASFLHGDLWWALLEQLATAAEEATALSLEEQPLARQLLSAELPLTLAYLFPELKRCRRLASPASKRLSIDVIELLDGEGIIRGGDLPLARPLLASWTRSRAMCEEIDSASFTSKAAEQYDWFVRQSVRMTRADGSSALSADASDWSRDMFEAALTLSADDDDWLAARWALPNLKIPSSAEQHGDLPEAAIHSEWSELAFMRCDWSRRASKLTTAYAARTLRVELETAGQLVLSGAWDPQVTFNGKRLHPRGDWEEVGWASDDDGDYLELEITLDNRCRVQRQFFLSREDRFLFMADAILADEHGRIEYVGSAPLIHSCGFQPAGESREGQICISRPLARVLPLALPEWRREPAAGELTGSGGGLQLQMTAEAHRLYVPLFFDLDSRRLKKECTWRRLTVAEGLEIQPYEVAAGYRVQIGRRQWIVYRSLAPRDNRSVLGQNTTADFLLARLDNTGEIETLVELE